jgi:hypothetical protein
MAQAAKRNYHYEQNRVVLEFTSGREHPDMRLSPG